MSNVIEIAHLNKHFGDVHAVQDLSFRVKKGELFAFLGINGEGKSTTIQYHVRSARQGCRDCTDRRCGTGSGSRPNPAQPGGGVPEFYPGSVKDNLQSRVALSD